jgi:hypothetical protein
MKKWIAWLLLLLILSISCIGLFVPSKISLSCIATAHVPISGESTCLFREEKWERWWRDASGLRHIKGEPFTFNGTSFRLTGQSYNAAGIEIDHNGMKLPSILHFISFGQDSTAAIWQCEFPAVTNTLARVLKYKNAIEIKKNMKGVLKAFTSFVSNPENIYGISITRVSTTDTTLLSIRFTSAAYPTDAVLYTYFDAVEKNIFKQKGKSTGFPMMNITRLGNDSFETEVAIPTTNGLKDDGKFSVRRMMPGNFMAAEVRGGTYTANEAQEQLELFIQDHNKVKMAKGFQLLVTNRLHEPDTSKWITKIYIPVVQ